MGNMVNLVCVDRNSACTCAKREGFGERSKDEITHKKIVFYADDYYCKQRVKRKKKKRSKKTKN